MEPIKYTVWTPYYPGTFSTTLVLMAVSLLMVFVGCAVVHYYRKKQNKPLEMYGVFTVCFCFASFFYNLLNLVDV